MPEISQEPRVLGRLNVDYDSEVIGVLRGATPAGAYLSPFNTPSELELRAEPSNDLLVIELRYPNSEPSERMKVEGANTDIYLGKYSGKVTRLAFHHNDWSLREPITVSEHVLRQVRHRLQGKESAQFVFEKSARLINRVLSERWSEINTA